MIKSLSILLTNKCNIRCEHCIVDAKPSGRRLFSEAYLENIIEGMKENNLQYIGITGGEPLLFVDLLKRVCGKCQKAGIKSLIGTNGFWASTPKKAEKTLQELFQYGVRKIIFSVDRYHEKYVPIMNIRNATTAASNQGIEYEVHISALNYRTVCHYTAVLKSLSIHNIYFGPIERAGRATEIESHHDDHTNLEINECSKVENPIVLPEGKVVACCDLLVAPKYEPRIGSPLCLGNLRKERLEEIINRCHKNKCLSLLRKYGPDGIRRRLDHIESWKNSNIGSYQGCKLCYWLFCDYKRAKKVLATVPP